MPPKVSVVMAVCNSEQFLRDAVESVLNQSFTDFEFILIDDFSTDTSATILDEYRDPRILRVRNEKNLGLTQSLNVGLRLARGEYIARMDADDVCLPNRFKAQVRFLDEHESVAVVGTGVRLVDEQGNPLQEIHFPTDHSSLKWYLCFYNPIAHPSVMMRKAAVVQVGGYDPALVRSQDYDLWWRLGMNYELANLKEIYVFLRQHSRQITNVYRSEQVLSGLSIPAKYTSDLLSLSVTEEMIQNIWSQDHLSVDKAIDIAEFILAYFELCKKDFQNKADQKAVAKDAVARTLSFLLPHAWNARVWPVLFRAMRIDPIKSLRVGKTFIWK